MELAVAAYVSLYGKQPDHDMAYCYHGNLHAYNATVKKTPRTITFHLSPGFEECEPEIQMGVMQYLLNKLNKTKISSSHIDMYHSFLRKMSDLAPVTKSDPLLEPSFQRCNERYFAGMLAQPNLTWGRRSLSLLGTYAFATDTIMISKVMQEDENLLDYVMYHEMLHKKHKFRHTSSRTHSHTKEFRDDEARFDDKQAELHLKQYLIKQRRITHTLLPRTVERPNFVQRIMGWT